MKIRIGILEQDRVYVSRLIRYFTTYYIDKIEISAFYDLEKFLEFIQHSPIDIFLASPDLVPADLELPRTMIMAHISEVSQAESLNGVKAVYKYQKAESLYREILGLYAELDKKTAYKESDGTGQLHFFMGASGGVGTTTMAASCAVRLASYGKKVLYFNLEENGILTPFLQGDGTATLSDVLYAVKSNRSNLVLKLESIVRKSNQGVYFYEPFALALDAHELLAEELEEILKTIMQYQTYDHIIVDADSTVLWKRDLLMQFSKNIFIVSDGSVISNMKLKKLLQELALRDQSEEKRNMAKVEVIYNRFKNTGRKAETEYQEPVFGVIEELGNNLPDYVVENISRKPFFDKLL